MVGAGQLDLGGQAHLLQSRNNVPRRVKLPPIQPMPRRVLKRVVVVVPSLAKCQQRNPPVNRKNKAAKLLHSTRVISFLTLTPPD
jgi:hypothetical protein